MDELLLNFLGREREKTVRIGERTCAMRLLSARETLSLRREIVQLVKRKRTSFSKLLLLLESTIVLYTTYQGFGIAKLAIELGFMGTLPWIATMVTAAWGACGTSAACYYAKAKAENTADGVTYETVCRGPDCER